MLKAISQRGKYQNINSDREGYTRIKNVYLPMRDGVELCADVFLPFSASKHGSKVPVICSLGPYGKDVPVLEFGLPATSIYVDMCDRIKPLGPDACFELADPILWVSKVLAWPAYIPDHIPNLVISREISALLKWLQAKEYGYALLRVDSRGVGGSQGRLDPWSMERSLKVQGDAEGQDLYDVIEWAGTQSWSSGKVALSGISYYGMSGYWAAMQKPPHLTCVVTYEAAVDLYQALRKGGILSTNFQIHWYQNLLLPYQGGKSDGTLDAEQLAANRVDYPALVSKDEYPDGATWKVLKEARKLSDIDVPFYMSGNWTDTELHLPGNIRAYNDISSKHKWLEMHTGNHLAFYYDAEHVALQKKFLDYFLLGDENSGILEVPRIRLIQHHGTSTFYREGETAFPPPDAEEVAFYLTPSRALSLDQPASEKKTFEYEGLVGTIDFEMKSTFTEPFEILGTPFVELEIATEAEDQDIFLTLRAFDTEGKVIVLEGNHSEPNQHFAKGYFRLSHRDEVEAGFKAQQVKVPSQPVVARSPVERGKVYSVTIPLLPAAFLLEKGQKISLEIGAQDNATTMPPLRHDGGERVSDRFGGKNILFSHGKLILPRVKRSGAT